MRKAVQALASALKPTVKRSQLVEGTQYIIVDGNSNTYTATFVAREDGRIYFTIDQPHPFVTSVFEHRHNQIGFFDNDTLPGFQQVGK